LLTCYSPVRHSLFISIATEWSAFDLHVLGTPPAFVLSQDQTLHRDFRLALNPLRVLGPPKNQRAVMSNSSMTTTDRLYEERTPKSPTSPSIRSKPVFTALLTYNPIVHKARVNCPHWLLALAIPFSRSDRGTRCRSSVDAGCSEGLSRTSRPKGQPAGKSPSGSDSLGGLFRRDDYPSRSHARASTERQRPIDPGPSPGRCLKWYRDPFPERRIPGRPHHLRWPFPSGPPPVPPPPLRRRPTGISCSSGTPAAP
jgi:hypothetical protein